MRNNHSLTPKPHWLRRRLPSGAEFEKTNRMIQKDRLHTVCREANCPNIWECYSNKTATFLILGDRCTRNCGFCAVLHGQPQPPDQEEPLRVARTVLGMGLKYVVVTSVTRDDLPDGGASHFAETIRNIRLLNPEAMVEILIPDFSGSVEALKSVLAAGPDVLNHNIETVARLYRMVRPEANYEQSLELIQRVSAYRIIPPKSGLMLGLGETDMEIHKTLIELYNVGCRFLTLGQYLQPSKNHLPVMRFVSPEEFLSWKQVAEDIGFERVASDPFVRSSYHAQDLYHGAAQIRSV